MTTHWCVPTPSSVHSQDGWRLPVVWWDTVTWSWGQTGLGSCAWGSTWQQDPLGTGRIPVGKTCCRIWQDTRQKVTVGTTRHGSTHSPGCVHIYPDFGCALLAFGSLLAKTRWGLSRRRVHGCPFCTYQIASLFAQQTGSASYPLSCHVQDCQGPVLSLWPSLWPRFCPYCHLPSE